MIALELLLLVFCLAASAFYAGIETGVVAINRLRLRHLVRRNVPGARTVQDFLNKPERLLGTTLVGTNLGHVAASVLAASLGARWLGAKGAWLAGILLTVVILVACEYIPKAWFQGFPARRALPFAGLLRVSSRVFAPVSVVLGGLLKLFLPGTRKDQKAGQPMVSREELMHLTREGETSGVLTPEEHRMIHGVFELKTTPCGEIMIPRSKFVCVPHDLPVPEVLKLAREKEYNRFPVHQADRKAFVGVLHIFDVLADPDAAGKTAQDFMRPPQLVALMTPVDHVLPRMRVTRQPMILVSDERMEVVGLVTLEDVLQEVVGSV